MKSRSTWLLVVGVFVVGDLFGIWMDWSTWSHHLTGRDIVFEVQDYQMANLQVGSGDHIWLKPPDGVTGSDLKVKWVGSNPCAGGGNPTDCIIDSWNKAPAGPYFFSCDSAKYSCPEPGIQQKSTGPIENLGYGLFLKWDFLHLFGIRRPSLEEQQGPPTSGTHPATGSKTAIVSCSRDTKTTVLQDPNGDDETTINASIGQSESVFWLDPQGFTLDPTNFPAGFCKNGNPGSGSTTAAQCDVSAAANFSYSVQAQTPAGCKATTANLIAQ
jgi:hypothetical protein